MTANAAQAERIKLDHATHTRAVRHLARRDPRLGSIVRRFGEPKLHLRKAGFATLVRIILEQQVSLASGRAVFSKLRKLAGGVRPANINRLTEKKLLAAGLSRQKARYCHNLARVITRGELRLSGLHRHSDEDCRELLMQQPGIGRWTADIYLMLAMGRPDIWPTGDLALELAQAQALGLASRPGKAESEELALAWRPWRSVAARILWHNYRNTR